MVQIEQSMLDADEFRLNTPHETINLVTGSKNNHNGHLTILQNKQRYHLVKMVRQSGMMHLILSL